MQSEHTIACDGYHQASVRTGYEHVIPQRSNDLFAMTAKKPGVITDVNKNAVMVQYDDGEILGYEIGRRFGNACGLIMPHTVITDRKKGERVEPGDAIVYNTGFFEPDFFNPKRVMFKTSLNVKTVLWESPQTLDDSSALSAKAANKLSTQITKLKTIMLRFDQSISRLVKVGDKLGSDDILCIIEDSITASGKLFDEKTLDTLRVVGAQAPRAHVNGVVEKIEVFYNGAKEDMSESVLTLVNEGDAALKKHAMNLNRKPFTGCVDGGFRIENDPLGIDCAAIKIYITGVVPMSTGDKAVFVNQMKSVTGTVLDKDYITEDGTVIDAIFGMQSLSNRIVSSPFIIGTTTTLLNVIAKQAVSIYKKA